MSVMIKGMEMPDDCLACPLCKIFYGAKWCSVPDRQLYRPSIRPEWCPLVEVKEAEDD